MTVRQAWWKALDDPLEWWVYTLIPISGALGNIVELGYTRSTLLGGLMGGLVVLGILCSIRRFIVGHWR